MKQLTVHFFLIYILVLLIWAFLLPEYKFSPYSKNLIFALGAIGLWRYSWFILNNVRAYIYQKKFKKIRKLEQKSGENLSPENVFLLVTTFRIGVDVSIEVYRAAIKEAINCGYNVTIITSIVEMSEERIIRKIFLTLKPPPRINLKIVRIKGTGKRDALAVGFRSVANSYDINLNKSVVAVIDGDSILEKDLIRKCARLFGLNPNLGGLTTDEDAILASNDFAHKIYRRWYKLRFAQRNITMSSLSLSNKVLTLTGRMSMIRANIVASHGFIDSVQNDHIVDPVMGTFRFLTGDDKSSWYDLAKEGWDMIYVPDVMVETYEEIPDKNYLKGSITLMTRWFGNQYRTNKRGVKLGRRRLNLYPLYALWDQRITMWTTPYGFFIALFGAIHWEIDIFFGYLWFVMLTRLLMTFAYFLSRKEIMASWPFFLYYNQLVGSFVKIYIWNHLYKQKWTRQKTKLSFENRFVEWYRDKIGNGQMVIKLLIFIITVLFLTQNISFEECYDFINFSIRRIT